MRKVFECLTNCTSHQGWQLASWQSRKLWMASIAACQPWPSSVWSIATYGLVTSSEDCPLEENMQGYCGYRPKGRSVEFKPHTVILSHCVCGCEEGILLFSKQSCLLMVNINIINGVKLFTVVKQCHNLSHWYRI